MAQSRKKTSRYKTLNSAVPTRGAKVQWKWGVGKAIGTVLRVFRERITLRIKGASITRNATPDEPALLVKSDQGGEALKSAGEVKPARRTPGKRRKKAGGADTSRPRFI